METMPPYTYKFVKNQGSNSGSAKQKKIGYLSKDVKVINDLIDDLSKLKTADNAGAVVSPAATHAATREATVAATASGEMTNPLEIDNDIPSIILANGSVVSLESLSLKPALYESSTQSLASAVTNGTGLFTWQDTDTIVNSTSKMDIPTSTSSEALSSTGSGSTQNLPFLEDFFNINLSLDTAQTTATTSSSSQESTTVSSTRKTETSPESATLSSTTETSTTTTTTTVTTTTLSTTTKLTTHPIWPDPFLDLATENLDTLRSDAS